MTDYLSHWVQLINASHLVSPWTVCTWILNKEPSHLSCKHVAHSNKQLNCWITHSAAQSCKHGWRPGWRNSMGFIEKRDVQCSAEENKDSLRKQEYVKVHPSYRYVIDKLNVCALLCRMMDVKRWFSFFPVYIFSVLTEKSNFRRRTYERDLWHHKILQKPTLVQYSADKSVM